MKRDNPTSPEILEQRNGLVGWHSTHVEQALDGHHTVDERN
jgi:hypothetical protein